MPETHMLKPYHLRVASTYALFETFMEILEKDGAKIVASAKTDRSNQISRSEFSMNHTIDKSSYKTIEFLGFESGQKPSEISGLPRLYYDRSKPFTKEVKFYDTYVAGLTIAKPDAYLIPQGWFNVIENLYRNGVHLVELKNDTVISVTVYEIKEFQTAQRPFEGHYLHSNTKVEKIQTKINFRKGDFMVPMNQEVNRYIMEVLEPESEDSFFNWNFFDMILQSKEGFSAYVFEDLAAEFLNQNPDLRNKLEAAKSENEELAKSGSAQLRWVYEHSPWKEKGHNRYPVYRVEKLD
jgi:hypothetical protein